MLPGRVISFTQRLDPRSEVPSRSTVALVGRDPELLRLRAKLISSAGYVVHFMTPDQARAEVGEARTSQVWVFCHTLEFYELVMLAVAIRSSSPEHKLLRLTGLDDAGQMLELFDELLEPVTGVDDLLQVVAQLAKESKRYE
jgi:hypothetical protein